MIGEKFGYLTVINISDKKLTPYNRVWECLCDCGKKHYVETRFLNNGKIKSCGCFKLSKLKAQGQKGQLPPGEAARNGIIALYVWRAKERNRPWNLTTAQCEVLFKSPCFYCGEPPSNHGRRKKSLYTYNGIDRLNNDQGYTVDNVVSCCDICNKAKRALSYENFMGWIKKLINHQIRSL